MESGIFFWNGEGVYFFFFFVKIFARLIIVKEDANTLIFHIFEYGAENVAECSAESGAK